MLSIHSSGVHPIPPSIWLHIVLEHACIINSDINTMVNLLKDRQVEFIYESELHYFFSQNKS